MFLRLLLLEDQPMLSKSGSFFTVTFPSLESFPFQMSANCSRSVINGVLMSINYIVKIVFLFVYI